MAEIAVFSQLRQESSRAFSSFFRSLDEAGIEYKGVSHWRSGELQDQLHSRGRSKPGKIVTNAKAGQSYHNWGLAHDISFPKGNHAEAARIAKQYGIEWGGDWKSFPDPPHFQYRGGMLRKWSTREIRDIFQGAGFTLKEAIAASNPGEKLILPKRTKFESSDFFSRMVEKWRSSVSRAVNPDPVVAASTKFHMEEVLSYTPAQQDFLHYMSTIDPEYAKDLHGLLPKDLHGLYRR